MAKHNKDTFPGDKEHKRDGYRSRVRANCFPQVLRRRPKNGNKCNMFLLTHRFDLLAVGASIGQSGSPYGSGDSGNDTSYRYDERLGCVPLKSRAVNSVNSGLNSFALSCQMFPITAA